MTAYFVAQIRIDDPAEYQRYLDACDAVFARFNGEYLAVDPAPTVLEGEWPYSRSVLIRFPCEADLLAWYNSPDYREIVVHRLAGAKCDSILVHGKDEG
ncbi:hypothetical protein ANOBCDAF_04656 [Pleomorphomonas sp. T1.2MG-36]|uniref:DUF1330 domain-containing protein n=1 Tax=Pleomorphomonas sp. T1.2MG-36 TaxID=3041167 RepID=UPI0024776982|nr:DUF1330 domain-containing protein [Pleomorphomonas sp. T1.2MG-36]CAI9404625.1 hypothetical protein ANOBCDAF_04656 [Pleomorphomonas sp. T1.2MG-36]